MKSLYVRKFSYPDPLKYIIKYSVKDYMEILKYVISTFTISTCKNPFNLIYENIPYDVLP